jgi:antitoxin component HigA of HigAB toxin-antitoxin module
MRLTEVKQPIKNYEQYRDRLLLVHELLQSNLRVGTRNYVKLGLSVVYINQYQKLNGSIFTPELVQIWVNIISLLKDKTRQKVMNRIGIELVTRRKRRYNLNRRVFWLLPPIVPDITISR